MCPFIFRMSFGLAIACQGALLRAEPPRVVKTSPPDGDTKVDPATAEVRVVFDQAMDHDAGYSVVGGGPTFPQIVGKPKWADDHTLVMRVRLKPDQDYWLSVNSDRFTHCRNRTGEPAVPYAVSFRTAAASVENPAAALIRQNRDAIAELRRAIDEDYSYRDLRDVDWDAAFREATPALEHSATPAEFARAASVLLAPAKDVHVWLKVGEELVGTHQRRVTPNFNPKVLPRLVPNLKQHGRTTLTGRFDDGIVYLAVGTWENREPAALEAVYAALKDAVAAKAPAVIIDVRPNSGGDEMLARRLAGSFVSERTVYSKNSIRRDGKWSPVYERAVEPTAGGPAYRGKVVVLMGPANMSSCESFLMMMKQVPGCVLMGEKSYGSSGNPKPHDLGNGVTVFLPSWKDLTPEGAETEGKGIEPDVIVKTTAKDFVGRDPVLEAALKRLREAAGD